MWEFIANGLVIGSLLAGIFFLYAYMKETKQKFAWWKWVLSIVWFLGVLIAFAFIGATYGEGSPEATLRGGASFVAIVLISGALIFRFCFMQSGGAKKESKSVPGKEV